MTPRTNDTDKSDKMREAERLIAAYHAQTGNFLLMGGAHWNARMDEARAALLAHIRTMEAPGLSAEVEESWWLIEAVAPPRPLYFAGLRRATEAKRPHQANTTEDAGKAVRYPTEDTAKLAVAQMIGADTSNHMWPLLVANSAWKVAEHIFDYTARQAAASLASAAGVQEVPPLTEAEIMAMRRTARGDTRCQNEHWFVLLVRLVEARYVATRPEVAAPLPETALQRYTRLIEGDHDTPLENLRFFCSLAMNGQDWLDVEPFFDALAAAPAPLHPEHDPVVAWMSTHNGEPVDVTLDRNMAGGWKSHGGDVRELVERAAAPAPAAGVPTPDMQEVAHALETAARFAIEGIKPPDAEVLHWREIAARCRAQTGSADAVTLLRELRDCGAISNWLRVSDDLRKRVDAAIDAAQGAAKP
ncbi:MAG: hypothetical protein WC023_06305 [Rhodocyclaceae bacterium]